MYLKDLRNEKKYQRYKCYFNIYFFQKMDGVFSKNFKKIKISEEVKEVLKYFVGIDFEVYVSVGYVLFFRK